jgi:ribosomal protein S18 acetylase RimI-like enzyme
MRRSSSNATSDRALLRLRPVGPDDEAFLVEMLRVAASWWLTQGEPPPPAAAVLADPQTADYVEDWGRQGDGGVVAEWDGEPVGACWYRRFTAAHPGYGFLGADVPGIGFAVRERFRRRGIGTRLLEATVVMLGESGAQAVSLSVELENDRARRLYQRAGFEPVGREGGSVTMRLALPRD